MKPIQSSSEVPSSHQHQQFLQQLKNQQSDTALRSSNSSNLLFFNDLKRKNILEDIAPASAVVLPAATATAAAASSSSKGTSAQTFSFCKPMNSHQSSQLESEAAQNQFQSLAEAATHSILNSTTPMLFAKPLTALQEDNRISPEANSNIQPQSVIVTSEPITKLMQSQPSLLTQQLSNNRLEQLKSAAETENKKPLYKIVQEEKEKKVLARLDSIKKKMRDSPQLSEFDTQLIHAYTSATSSLVSPSSAAAIAAVAASTSPKINSGDTLASSNKQQSNNKQLQEQRTTPQTSQHKFRSSLLSPLSQTKLSKQPDEDQIPFFRSSSGFNNESELRQKYEEEIRRINLQHRLRSDEQENTIRQLRTHMEAMEQRNKLSLNAATEDIKKHHHDTIDKERAARQGIAELRGQFQKQIESLQEQLKGEKDNSLRLSRQIEDMQSQFKERQREMSLLAKNAEKEQVRSLFSLTYHSYSFCEMYIFLKQNECKRKVQECLDEVEDRIAQARRMKDAEHALEVQKLTNVFEGKIESLELEINQSTQMLREAEMRQVEERQYYLDSESSLKQQVNELESEVVAMKKEQDALVEKAAQFESIIQEVEDELKNARLEVQQLQVLNRELESDNAALFEQQNALKPKNKKSTKKTTGSSTHPAKKNTRKSISLASGTGGAAVSDQNNFSVPSKTSITSIKSRQSQIKF